MDEWSEGLTLGKVLGFIFIVMLISFPLGLFMRGCAWWSKANDVAFHEVDPAYILKKYEWFKEASAGLDKKLADLKVYEVRVTSLKKDYEGKSRTEWARDDREQYSIWMSESAGISASYNDLASEYNAQMSKMNWRFTNVGMLPQGATETLPREYKPYATA